MKFSILFLATVFSVSAFATEVIELQAAQINADADRNECAQSIKEVVPNLVIENDKNLPELINIHRASKDETKKIKQLACVADVGIYRAGANALY